MAPNTSERRFLKSVASAILAAVCFLPGGGMAQLETMTLSGSESGYAGPIAPIKPPAAGEHRVIPLLPHPPFSPPPGVKDRVLQQGSTGQVTRAGTAFNGIGVSS